MRVAIASALLLLLTLVAAFPRTLLADDQPAADSSSSLRLLPSYTGNLPAQAPAPLVRQSPAPSPASASTSVANGAAPQPLFSRTRWEGPAAVVPREPDLQWKGAFHAVRPSSAMVDPCVVQASATQPLDAVRPVSLPSPSNMRLGKGPDPTPAQPPAGRPPLPVQAGPAAEPNSAPLPTIEQQLAPRSREIEHCSSPRDLKSIREITADISIKPELLASSMGTPQDCLLGGEPFRPRHWHGTTFAWTAAATCHTPLYFEDEQLERYGHSWGNVKQTAVSAVRFFATVPMLPYYMGVYPPNECIYDLGQYRPGSCAPYYLDPLPLSVRGALYEGTFLGLFPVAL